MIDPNWVFAAAALGLTGALRYCFFIVRGSVRPSLVSWSLWATASLIAFLAQLDAGVGLPAIMTLAAGLGPVCVVATSLITRRFFTRFTAFDFACLFFAVVALGVWIGLGQAPLAVWIAVTADLIAALPTVVKSWRHPDTENALFYLFPASGAAITFATITVWAPQTWAFVAYQFSICVVLAVLIVVRRRVLGTSRTAAATKYVRAPRAQGTVRPPASSRTPRGTD